MNQGITTPASSPLKLDTSTHISATDIDGKIIVSEITGKPVTIAQDLISGVWYALVATSFGRNVKPDEKAAHQDLVDAGGVHVAHDDQRYRGVWVPLEAIAGSGESEDDEVETHDEDGNPVTPSKPVKRVAKKASKR